MLKMHILKHVYKHATPITLRDNAKLHKNKFPFVSSLTRKAELSTLAVAHILAKLGLN